MTCVGPDVRTAAGDPFRATTASQRPSLRVCPAGAASTHAPRLHGRDEQLCYLEALARRSDPADPVAVLVTGPAGVGRSSLLEAFAERLPGDCPVLWPAALGTGWTGPDLHEEVLSRAADGSCVIVVDDAHLAPAAILDAVGYVLRRSGSRCLTAVITAPADRFADEPPALRRLLTGHGWVIVELGPLNHVEVTDLVAARCGHLPDQEVLHQLFRSSQGIPALLQALLDAATSAAPGAVGWLRADLPGAAPRLRSLGIALQADRLRTELARFPAGVTSAAAAAALLGDGGEDPLLGPLSGQSPPTVQLALGLLRDHRLVGVSPAGFLSEDTRRAALAAIDAPLLDRLARRGAALLEQTGRSPEQVAEQLMRLQRCPDAWMLRTLLESGRRLASSGHSDVAARHLAHALRSGGDGDPRLLRAIRSALAEVVAVNAPEAAVPHLRILLDGSVDGTELAVTALRTVEVLVTLGRFHEAAQLLARTLDDGSPRRAVVDPELRPSLEAGRLIIGVLGVRTVDDVRRRVGTLDRSGPGDAGDGDLGSGDRPADRRLRLVVDTICALAGSPGRALDRPAGAMVGPRRGALDHLAVVERALAQHLAARDDLALAALDGLHEQAVATPGDQVRAAARLVRSLVCLGRGEIQAAERWSRGIVAESPTGPTATGARLQLAVVAVLRGDTLAAQALLAEARSGGLWTTSWDYPGYLVVTGLVRRAMGDLAGALTAYLSCGRVLQRAQLDQPVLLPWWLPAVELLVRSGRHAEAKRVAGAQGSAAKAWGTPKAVGWSLLARAALDDGGTALGLLREACGVLAASGDPLAQAHAQSALGAALLRDGDRKGARRELHVGLDLAVRCGATAQATALRRLITRAGGRVLREVPATIGTLTAAQYRVALLAARGRSNAEIAEELVISRRTVELHLTHAYRKLGLTCRDELGSAFDGALCVEPAS